MFMLFQSVIAFWFSIIFFVPYTGYIVSELKKTEGARGAVKIAMFIAGFSQNLPKKIDAYPDLKRMDRLDFIPHGNENVFIS